MTAVYITIDTEYEPGFTARRGVDSRAENFARSIQCETPDGAVGIEWQLEQLDRHGLKSVFFVDPMPALLWGVEAITDMVGPIVSRRHDVQLHLHTEWLALAGPANPLGSRTGANIKDFNFDEQCALIDYAKATLASAGAPSPIAFRAGNFGANDDTLRALAEHGLTHDSSHSPGFPASACAIGLGPEHRQPLSHCGVTEVPVGCIHDVGNRLRHVQITALSFAEMRAALRHASASGVQAFTIVSHSFELLNHDRTRINPILRKRFAQLCEFIGGVQGVSTETYASLPPIPSEAALPPSVLPANAVRTGLRLAEQALANAF